MPGQDALIRRAIVGAFVSAAALLFIVIVSTAWISDDAYITARTIDNWLNGHGLRWNAGERVQAYTHPLWLIVEAAAWWITGGPYWSMLAVSLLCAMAAAVVLSLIDGVTALAAAALLFLTMSQPFVDFATSGLETPLTYLLLALFLAAYWRDGPPGRRVLQITTLAALAAVNRLDTLVLLAPALVHVALVAWPSAKMRFVLGFAPLMAWEVFSVVYYGFPFPNTAYAKLATGIPQSELTAQGLAYLANSWRVDPLTLVAIAVAVAAGLWRRHLTTLTIAGGLVLHIVYVVRVGGDFMSGRFLAPGVVVAVGVLLREGRTPRLRTPIALALLAAAVVAAPRTASRTWGWPWPPAASADALIDAHGIADERLFYAPETGLIAAIRRGATPTFRWELAGRQAAAAGATAMARDSVGFFGFGAGPSVHIVDTLALGDPLLARLPADRPWRIGHFHRPVPAGYMDLLRGRTDHLADPALDAYYTALRTITRGPLWSRARWAAILALNTSQIRAPAPAGR